MANRSTDPLTMERDDTDNWTVDRAAVIPAFATLAFSRSEKSSGVPFG